MNLLQIDGLAQKYAMEYEITERQAHILVSNALAQDGSGKVLVFALALLAQEVDIDAILTAMAFGETAWYRSAESAL
jgi:hypothetical protein